MMGKTKEKKNLKEWFRALKFGLISVSAGIIQIGLFTLLNELLLWNYWVAYLLSLLASIIWNFTINRRITFKSSNNIKIAMLLVLLFYAIFTPVSTILGSLAESNGVNEYIVLAITMIANFVLEFLYTRFVVYRNSCDTAISKEEKEKLEVKKKPLLYKMIKGTVNFFYKDREFIGIENLPSEPAIIVGNHAQLHGPLSSELYFPTKKYIWCASQMMSVREVPAYAYKDFWSRKPKCVRWVYKILSYLIAPLCAYIFKHADTIPVYRDERTMGTFKRTIRGLEENANIIIFPEYEKEFNNIVNEFQTNFIDIARLYYKKHSKELYFVPMYNAVKLKKVIIGKPIKFDHNLDIEEQKREICGYLKNEITKMAKELPEHRVVPYLNIPKKEYKKNREDS